MRTRALELLACPSCGGALVAVGGEPAADGHLMSGVLACGCGLRFPIHRGVPRLVLRAPNETSTPAQVTTLQRAGLHWILFEPRSPAATTHHEQWFLDSVAPLRPRDFADKKVLVAEAGNGITLSLLAGYGPLSIVALERTAAADLAFANTRHLQDVHVVQGEITNAPTVRTFDLVLGGSALHREPHPELVLRSMWQRAVIGGRIAFHMPSFEKNQWLLSVLEPVRASLTSRLPDRVLYWATLAPALVAAALVRGCQVKAIAARIPYGTMFAAMKRTPLHELHRSIFAELAAPLSSFAKREDIERWLGAAQLGGVHVEDLAGYAWRATAEVVRAAEPQIADAATAQPTSIS